MMHLLRSVFSSAIRQDEDYIVLLQLAVVIFRRSPLAGASGFSMKDSMIMAGVKKEMAATERFMSKD